MKDSDGGKSTVSVRFREVLTSLVSSPFRAALAYILFAGLWIVFSDRAVLRFAATDPDLLSALQTAKGWLFVTISGLLIGLLGLREGRTRDRAEVLRRQADARAVRNYRELLARLVALETGIGVAQNLLTVHRALREFVTVSVPMNGLVISRYDAAEELRYCVYAYVEGEEEDVSKFPPMPMNDSPHARAVASGEVIVTRNRLASAPGRPGYDLGFSRNPNPTRSSVAVPLIVNGEVLGAFEVQSVEEGAYGEEHVTALRLAANIAAIATANVRLHERESKALAELERSEARFRSLVQNSSDIIRLFDADGTVRYESPSLKKVLGYEPDERVGRNALEIVHPDDLAERLEFAKRMKDGYAEAAYRVQHANGEWRWIESIGLNLMDDPNVGAFVVNSRDVTERMESEQALRDEQEFTRSLLDTLPGIFYVFTESGKYVRWNSNFPRVLGYEPDEMGSLGPLDVIAPEEREFIAGKIEEAFEGSPVTVELSLLTRDGARIPYMCTGVRVTLGGQNYIAGIGLDGTEQRDFRIRINALNDDLKERLERLTSLREIDRAISGSLELSLVLGVFLQEARNRLVIDGATVLLHQQESRVLTFGAGKGMATRALRQTEQRLGEGPAGRAALTREIVHLSGPEAVGAAFSDAREILQESYESYWAVPLLAKGRVQGVLELFSRREMGPDEDWYEFLDALATQAAIAIDNAVLFQTLAHSNSELRLAYDTTIEGWARALDLRDQETEGHTRRVTELTVNLARKFRLSPDELVQVRRGALLHDIGKMAIPDAILLKPGKLDPDEWEIMKEHPEHAYRLLSPIGFLRPALDIPYAHHEKWDGSGYPRGLKGEEIPLTARIFAVVDVFDALTSRRPYHAPRAREEALAFIREQSAKHFDPRVVEAFFEMID